ncbi:cytochrome c [Bernardetia sp. Wsw4-3y2]|uniref:c-type cytochrome n=1 Tax=Bernardetia sp. Wsw4-3y2 TaxID=3127471 RepID=UPI0030CF69C8
MSSNNEILTLSGLILGVGLVLIITVVMLFNGSAQTTTSKTTQNTATNSAPVEDINTKVASLAEPQKAIVLQGNELFQGNCAQCHAIDKKVVGPALKGVTARWENESEIINFIKYPEKVITGGKNNYASKLYEEYGQMMPNHDFFSDQQIQSILTYVKFESGEEIAMK